MRSADASPVAIAAQLEAAGIAARCTSVEPSLEDVFLDIAQRAAGQ
jgi:Ribonuclease G/E